MKRALIAIASLTLTLAACGSDEKSTDDGAVDVAELDSGTPDVSPDTFADDGGAEPDPVTPPKYTAIAIYDTEPKACNLTTGPGTDIDAVALIENGEIVGYGLSGSAAFAEGSDPCTDAECKNGNCKYANTAFVSRTEGAPDAIVNASTDDSGYFSLNGGALGIQFGDLLAEGPAKEIRPGTAIRIHEVDQLYKTAANGCVCAPEHYEVWALVAPGDMTGAVRLTPTAFASENAAVCGDSPSGAEGCGTTVFELAP